MSIERRSRVTTTLLALLALLLTFAAGVVVGGVGSRMLQFRRGGPMVPEHAGRMMLNRLDRRLDLTDEQREKVGEILRRRHARINSLWTTVRPRVEEELAATNAEIAKVLTPEQRREFEEMKLRMHGRAPRGPH